MRSCSARRRAASSAPGTAMAASQDANSCDGWSFSLIHPTRVSGLTPVRRTTSPTERPRARSSSETCAPVNRLNFSRLPLAGIWGPPVARLAYVTRRHGGPVECLIVTISPRLKSSRFGRAYRGVVVVRGISWNARQGRMAVSPMGSLLAVRHNRLGRTKAYIRAYVNTFSANGPDRVADRKSAVSIGKPV